ncbi:hypothetical protein POM88_013369 [Heracleum sosnowskyi]|uniref:Uncharacterized protein n=1 Tax=Heracleum sosnowskyi TaxID=360622 RepID=A0AAD8IZR8_9APIA|nr:hypothetical protein POM88_013369 [Heracleum sosnowskyi]
MTDISKRPVNTKPTKTLFVSTLILSILRQGIWRGTLICIAKFEILGSEYIFHLYSLKNEPEEEDTREVEATNMSKFMDCSQWNMLLEMMMKEEMGTALRERLTVKTEE